MPRLSLWREKKGNDYKFFDRRISEMFTIGGTDINVHKYLGPLDQSVSVATSASQGTAGTSLTFSNTQNIDVGAYVQGDGIVKGTKVASKTATTITLSLSTSSAVGVGTALYFYTDPSQPPNPNSDITTIQDLLFLENRDRKYDQDVYTLRGLYRVNDNDFDLSQFGLFLTGDTLFMVFHLNDMVDILGRKLIVGDVLELPHLKDYYPLDEDLPAALKRYYVITDANRAAEGFAPTWYPHLWRIKCQPLVDSQEYKDLLNNLPAGDTNGDGVVDANDQSLGELLSTYNKYIDVNDAIVQRAEQDVPKAGYDTSFIYTMPENHGYPGDPGSLEASDTVEDASESVTDASAQTLTPDKKVTGYLTQDALPPNGAAVNAGIAFPTNPIIGDFFLRLDFIPNRLFRFDGRRWAKIEDNLRTNLTLGQDNTSQRSSFVNNTDRNVANPIARDHIKAASPYTAANATTISFNLSTGTVVTNIPYVIDYGVRTWINGTPVKNTMSNSSGNIGFTVSVPVTAGAVLSYTVYGEATNERQSLSEALRPRADN